MKWIVLIITLFQVTVSNAQQSITEAEIQKLDSIALQDVPAGAPGIATAIIRNGKLIYKKTGGYASLADSSLITGKSRFNIASNGKQFTAMAVLTLVESGKLKLSDDIRTCFPGLFPKVKDPITIRNLLNHTSGIRDCYDLWSLQGYTWWEQSFSNADVLNLIRKQEDLNFRPGSDYLYSNTNYILLAMLVEKRSGKSFTTYTNELFRKLNMPNTSFESDYTRIRGPIARAYFNFGSWTTYNWIWNVCGDGNLFTTLDDQIQWELLLQGGGKTSLKRDLLEKLKQPLLTTVFRNYGYGVEFGKYKGMDYRFHEGATGAWKATVLRFDKPQTTILTLTNTGKAIPSIQSRQMADVLFSLKQDAAYLVTKPAKTGDTVSLEEIQGVYLTPEDFTFQFEIRDNKLFLKRIGRNDVELEREAANIFHQKYDPLFKQEFTKTPGGTLQVTAYYINHAPYSLVKQDADFSAFNKESLNGTYHNPETGAVIDIKYQEGKTYLIKQGSNDASSGLLITPGKLLYDFYALRFDPVKGNIETFFLNGDRIRNVKFIRQR